MDAQRVGLQPQRPYTRTGITADGNASTRLHSQLSLLCARLILGTLTSIDVQSNQDNLLKVNLKTVGRTYAIKIYQSPPESPSVHAAKDEVSALMWLTSKRLPVPFFFAYDFSKDNEIGFPYLLEGVYPGTTALEAYTKLSLDEKTQVIDAVVKIMIRMKTVTFEQAGKLRAPKSQDLSVPMCHSRRQDERMPGTRASHGAQDRLQFADVFEPRISPPPAMEDVAISQPSQSTNYAQQLDDAMEQMAGDDFFFKTAAESNCLYFRDLLPNNVILAKANDGTWTVAGILCRDAWSLNETVAASPPSWLWGGISDQQSLQLNSTRKPAIFGQEKIVLKKRYDHAMERMSPDRKYYEKQTYGLGKWFRRMMQCQLFLLPMARYPEPEIENFVEGWGDYAKIHSLVVTKSIPQAQETKIYQPQTPEQQPEPAGSPEQASPEVRDNSGAKRAAHEEQVIIDLDGNNPHQSSDVKPRLHRLCLELGIGPPTTFLPNHLGFTRFETREGIKYNLRTAAYQAVKDEVASHLAAGTMVAVARMISYNASRFNPWQRPYILYEALPESDGGLHTLKYSSTSRFALAEELAVLTKTMAGKCLSGVGFLTADSHMPDYGRSPALRPRRTGIRPFFDRNSLVRPSLRGFVSAMLNEQASASCAKATGSDRDRIVRAYWNLHIILSRMVTLGLLANPSYAEYVLVNLDTRVCNVSHTRTKGNQESEGVFKLEGVISWKESVSLPKIFAFPPPSWLWRVRMAQGGYWWLAPINEPSKKNREDRAVMQHYNDVMGPEIRRILNITHQQNAQMQMVRRLGYFALEGQLGRQRNYLIYEQFVAEWDNVCRARNLFEYAVPRPVAWRTNWSNTVARPLEEWRDQWVDDGRPNQLRLDADTPIPPPDQSSAMRAPPPKRPVPAPLDDEALIERELKRARSDRRLERAREIIRAPPVVYPQQVYVKGEDRADSDDECVITEVRKLRSSSDDESENDTADETEEEAEK